jgi:hypothetical protein
MPNRWAIANGNFSSTSTWNDGAILGIPTGSDDLFSNTFTVNVDQSFTAVSLNNVARARDIATPLMTGYTSPQGTAISSGDSGVGLAWRAFNRNTTNNIDQRWASTTNNSGWIGFQFNNGLSAKVINQYLIYGSGATGNNPSTWTFEGSNDGSSWTVLHTVTATTIGANSVYSSPTLANTTSYEYYRINVTAVGTVGNTIIIPEIEFYERFTAALAAGGSFNFNSGSISGSVTSTSPLGIGATNLITVTATTGSVGLTLGGAVANPSIASAQVINHTGNCDFRLSGTTFTGGGNGGSSLCINKSSLGTIYITGSLRGGGSTDGNLGKHALNVNNGNVILLGNCLGGTNSGGATYAINQSAGNLIITGQVEGGGGGISFPTNYAINFTGTSITITGNVIGGTIAPSIVTTAPTTITGNVSGSAAAGISTTAPVIVSGSVVAQGAAAAITSTSAIFINVSGSVIASATANGISSTNASAVVNLAGNIVNVNGKQAIYCQNLFLDNTATTQARFFTFGGQDRTLYSVDTFPNLPSASNVRFGTSYGPGSGNTGTLRMASPQDVRSGVLTDNTTGSAILSMESLSNEIQTSTDPFAQRLRNISTVDTVGYLLTAFKK